MVLFDATVQMNEHMKQFFESVSCATTFSRILTLRKLKLKQDAVFVYDFVNRFGWPPSIEKLNKDVLFVGT